MKLSSRVKCNRQHFATLGEVTEKEGSHLCCITQRGEGKHNAVCCMKQLIVVPQLVDSNVTVHLMFKCSFTLERLYETTINSDLRQGSTYTCFAP